MKKVKLNEMKMFQVLKIRAAATIEKVPGGWVYSEWYEDMISNVFIPNSKEIGDEEYEVVD